MFNLMIILSSAINSEPIDSNNYKIAKYIIEHIHELEDITLTELAKNCYVSNSSISRFCRAIGFKDFNTLKIQVARFASENKYAKEKFQFKPFNDQSVCQSYILSVIDNLNHLYQPSLDKEIQQLVNDIAHYQKIAAFGYLQSENIALNMQYDLRTNNKIIFSCIKFVDQVEYIQKADKNTLIIIFSESGTYFDRVFQRTKPFKNTKDKPKICMITANANLSLPYVDQMITCHSRNDYASHPYPLGVIADLICIQYARLAQERNEGL